MKVLIFDSLDKLNEYLEEKKDVDVQFRSFVVAESKDPGGRKVYEILDRFLVTEK